MLSVPSIMILVSMVLLSIMLAAALYHIYREPANPEGGHDAESDEFRRKGLLRPYR